MQMISGIWHFPHFGMNMLVERIWVGFPIGLNMPSIRFGSSKGHFLPMYLVLSGAGR